MESPVTILLLRSFGRYWNKAADIMENNAINMPVAVFVNANSPTDPAARHK